MVSLDEAQAQFLRAIEGLEAATAKLRAKQAQAATEAQEIEALRAGYAKLTKAYAQLDSENRGLRDKNAKISERLDRAISGLRETLGA